MKIAIPLAGGKLTSHFGHCERFAIMDADPMAKKVLKSELVTPPPHEPGLFPAWLAERGATRIMTGPAHAASTSSRRTTAVVVFAENQIFCNK